VEHGKQCIVVGGGIAGASVAWHLARSGREDVMVVEREESPGTHASSQNAAMVRSLELESGFASLALEGADFWRDLPAELDAPGRFRKVGSLLLASEESSLCRLRQTAFAHQSRSQEWSARRCREVVPALVDTPVLGGVFTPGDGVADPVGLVSAFLAGSERRGVEVRTSCNVADIHAPNRRVRGLVLGDGQVLPAQQVVLAAGAWAPDLMARAGAADRGLRPYRRHLFCTAEVAGHVPGMGPEAPFVWHIDGNAYMRWEAGGMLFSACDEDLVEAGRPGTHPEIAEFANRRLSKVFPFLVDLPVSRCWAGLRSFAADRHPVLGADPEIEGLFHAAGLGGHGVTCAGSAGRLVAASIEAQMGSVAG
jgi:glycine/D-amino acid oxidase-like deaminating enzyme